MIESNYKNVFTFFIGCLLGLPGTPVFAELFGENLPPPPVHAVVDSKGIDMLSLSTGIGGMSVSIGTKDSGIESNPGRSRYSHDNFSGTMTEINVYSVANTPAEIRSLPVGKYIKVDSLGGSELFAVSGTSYVNYKNTGGTLSCNLMICTYTFKDGTVVLFDQGQPASLAVGYPSGGFNVDSSNQKVPPAGSTSFYKGFAQQTKITKPNGEIINLYYVFKSGYSFGYGGYVIRGVSSSLGWMLKYYRSDAVQQANGSYKGTRSITAINTSIEYCDPLSETCNQLLQAWPMSTMLTSSLQTVNSLYPNTSNVGESSQVYHSLGVLNAADEQSVVKDYYGKEYDLPVAVSPKESYVTKTGINYKFKIPGSVSINGTLTPAPFSGMVQGVTVSGLDKNNNLVFYDFNYNDHSGPDGDYIPSLNNSALLGYTDKLSRKTTYTYVDQWYTRVDKIIDPDATPNITNPTGGYTQYAYDNRGNITSITTYPKNSGTP